MKLNKAFATPWQVPFFNMRGKRDMTQDNGTTGNYTCNEYREEMILLGLQKQLAKPGLAPEEKERLLKEIHRLERQMGMD